MVDHSGWVLFLYIVNRISQRSKERDTRCERRIEEGDVAQLGERRPRTAEASGSIPLISTNYSYLIYRESYLVKKQITK
jgi:hypothetical protein